MYTHIPVAYHGISAFGINRKADLMKLQENTMNAVGNEICVADRPIGPIGILVEGEIRAAFSEDVWSIRDKKTGKRIVSGDGPLDDDILSINDPDRWEWEEFCCQAQQMKEGRKEYFADPVFAEKTISRAYCEAWMTPERIVSVWVKAWAPKKMVLQARLIACKYGVPCMLVEATDRIWSDTSEFEALVNFEEAI